MRLNPFRRNRTLYDRWALQERLIQIALTVGIPAAGLALYLWLLSLLGAFGP